MELSCRPLRRKTGCLYGGGSTVGVKIGVLALQGSFREHAQSLIKLGVEPVFIRFSEQLDTVSGLIIPGGESTTIGKLIEKCGLKERLRELARAGFPIYGTCAGLIVLARNICGYEQPVIGGMDITVKRNAFGRQRESFEENLCISILGEKPFRGVFIRAPLIEEVVKSCHILARLKDGRIVAAEQGTLLVSSFHPELTDDPRMHRYFLNKIAATWSTLPAMVYVPAVSVIQFDMK